ncbi:MAG: leucine--tRNA ligase [Nitrososphaerota archaeon]|nr:leucine--tRNA ligase [Nitrososphaerota archaeon]
MTEKRWIDLWRSRHMFEPEVDYNRRKVLVTFPIPYMNGPLHLGHAFTVIKLDVYARYKRMRGFNVLFPQGWQWTGQSITSAVSRLAKGDESMIKEFRDIDGVDEETLAKFKDPLFMARYYTERNRDALVSLGISIDWRREFHTTSDDPRFSKFVEWQFLALKEKGYINKGTHPVVWCPNDKSPVGDHDRLTGEGVFAQEFSLVMFKLADEEKFLVASTLRPETLYGTTNVWISPDAEYVEAEVNGRIWIVGAEAIIKLENQLFKVKIQRRFKGSELIGRKCIVPIKSAEVPILRADFIDPSLGTAVVFSVPAHAPFDMLALLDLKEGYIEPISIIEVKGYGSLPALDVIKRMKLRGQLDEGAKEATKEIYSKEFRDGRMKSNCGEFAGMSVPDARAATIRKLKGDGLGASMFDLAEPVICRCTARCTVKVLSDQWFFRYSDTEWKDNVRRCLSSMEILPESARPWFNEVISWLNDYPCARTSGLGTPLPWDKKWVIETLSDSTVYMAYYTFSHLIQAIDPELMTPSFFNYILYGEGDIAKVSAQVGIGEDLLESMRKEFLYWYPVDMRNSAKELVPNHLTFFIFHHVALFDESKWPRSISVNGMLKKEGLKMSKSRGNVLTINNAIAQFGADAVRATLLMSAENMDDANWRDEDAKNLKERLNKLLELIDIYAASKGEREDPNLANDYMDDWLMNRLITGATRIGELIESMSTRSAMQIAFFDLNNHLRDYLHMKINPNRYTILKFLDGWVKVLEPFIPFISEELNERLGNSGSVLDRGWPSDIAFIEEADFRVELVKRLVDDIREIRKVVRVPDPSFFIYTAEVEKQDLLLKIINGEKLVQNIDKKMLQRMYKLSREMTSLQGMSLKKGAVDELLIYKSASEYIEKEAGAKIHILAESKASPSHIERARLALPLRPAIVVEGARLS